MGGFDEIHIGLNDLHLSYGMSFMFEPLANGTVEELCKKFKAAGVPYGFGGIAKLGDGMLPADTAIENTTGIGEAVCKEYEQVMMLIDESFYYDADGYLREKNDSEDTDGISGVRRLYHGLSRAKKKIAVVVKNNPEVFEGILSILQGEATVTKHRVES